MNDTDTDLTDDERETYEAQWQQLDEKVILAQILTELQQIRLLLQNADSGAQSDADDAATYRCRECQTTLPADARERHAREQHKAPPGMEERFFERVSE
jgi:hypothetical protein